MGRILRKKSSRKKQRPGDKPDAELQVVKSDEKKETSPAVAPKEPVVSQPKQNRVAKAASVKTERGIVDKALQFLREVKVELKKVTWPTRKQTLGSTAVVIVLVMIISLFLGIVDFGLSHLLRVVLN